jgi:hypothetical protein
MSPSWWVTLFSDFKETRFFPTALKFWAQNLPGYQKIQCFCF